jgi:hypothetical protein
MISAASQVACRRAAQEEAVYHASVQLKWPVAAEQLQHLLVPAPLLVEEAPRPQG